MAIKKNNVRVAITLSRRQAEWLKKTAKKCDMTVSRLIKFLIDKNLSNLISKLPPKDFERIVQIARTPWIVELDDDEDDDIDIFGGF